ncbi:diguanylate cyclase (GGDEF)-like protein/PAS domain S-box-containing protein [Kibdelosporangium banguiense]|uniref:Diguanylate cyclase (GGDEF)-like protein/PAS domain S-box-containing protein n=1 Tax=Kibdelosporangium banguiense TaxID=1365924 RepID=A0ABS4TTL6_9PSEU|nr:diguanylate cyclase [Kibdelosporangium banguiense]MBP2327751.1 diguanylate cyclase (GGDEF)-like protein/PAS domain S-box-containing protein [Kibdelosporangium banguiense]
MPQPRSQHTELAAAWRHAVLEASYIPRSPADLDVVLTELVGTLIDALTAPEFSTHAGTVAGAQLVTEGFVDPDALTATVQVLTDGLPTTEEERTHRTPMLLGALCAGYAEALRKHTLDQQEGVNQALLNSVVRAEKNLRATESRFQEVFVSSATGIAITDLNGMCLEANPALGETLGRRPQDLMGVSVTDMFRDDAVMRLYSRILEGAETPMQEQFRLRRANGEKVWVLLAVTLLRDDADEPAYFVTMVQDVTELRLLQDRLSHQLLYDALTGLPNRQCFHTKLESMLGSAAPGTSITLCCINLDGFAMVNNSLGHPAGDRLLQAVGHRLEHVVAGQNASVARISGDEFAVLIEDPATPVPLDDLVGAINRELSEPEYIDGRGIAVGASVGAIRRLAAAQSADELFRAADIALRKAKATGRRQWAGYHERDDLHATRLDQWAVELPGAWETGDLAVAYEPVIRLADRCLVGVRAVLRWTRPDTEPMGHDDCVRLAERTGLSVHLGPLILTEAMSGLPLLRPALEGSPLVRIQLTRNQSGDADLIRAVNQAITPDPSLLEVCLHTGAVLEDFGDAQDNLEVLHDIGVTVGLCEFNGGPRELDLLARTGVRSVTLAAQCAVTATPLLRAETARVISMIRDNGVDCSVVNVSDPTEATYWTNAGAITAQGGMFGPAVAASDLETLLGLRV